MPITRCLWPGDDPLYLEYHDKEWGVPIHDDRKLFEFLILEGMQACGMVNDHLVSCFRYKKVPKKVKKVSNLFCGVPIYYPTGGILWERLL